MEGLDFAVGSAGCETSQGPRTSKDEFILSSKPSCALLAWSISVKPGIGGRSSLKVNIEVKTSFRVNIGKRPQLVLRRLRCYFFNVSLSLTLSNGKFNFNTHL